jgi:hypothetical protein
VSASCNGATQSFCLGQRKKIKILECPQFLKLRQEIVKEVDAEIERRKCIAFRRVKLRIR